MIYGWVGHILWVDLSRGRAHTLKTLDYGPAYIGGRGIAARIAWEHIPPGTGAFDPENLLMILTGPLTGTTAPFSGRTTVAGLSPQGYPHEWFSRANLGGHWGPALKYAGFDGLIIRGRADHPVYLWIEDGKVEIRDAAHLWGLGAIEAQQRLIADLGEDVRVLAIGQAGEHLSRIATINSETGSAAGQGGFGAVMGAKNLKAIAVRGTGRIRIAHPDLFLRRCKAIAKEVRTGSRWSRGVRLDPEKVKVYGQKWQACTQQCGMCCGPLNCRGYTRVKGPISGRVLSGQFQCVANFFPGLPHTFYDWNIGFEAGFELRHLSDNYGLNQWDLVLGIIPWLRLCKEAGLITTLDGLPLNFDDPHVWAELMRRIAYREGVGDALAEGGRRAPAILGFGEELADSLYLAWGYAGHWDGHGDRANRIVFPFWLVPALQWAVDTRDPFNSSHGYVSLTMHWSPLFNEEGLSWDKIKNVAQRLYGSAVSVDPKSGYEAKAAPAVWHGHRSALKDSVTVSDCVFPVILSFNSPTGLARADGMEGPNFEYHLFTAATGMDLGLDDFERAGERIFNLERAIQVRQFGRCRADDEMVIPYFQRMEWWENPLLGKRCALDRNRFLHLMDEYYELRGWDCATGRPTFAKLKELGLSDVAEELAARRLIER